ncbi:MAG TPA: arylamine N-acetyltransferase [Ktedonobacterales bacterium]|nr:arylamine N-acetyltransferase [Ktedonobacterales bacterium]
MSAPTDRAAMDPTAYLARIGQQSPAGDAAPSLALLGALHQAHLFTVPFENLSIHYGQPIVLDDAALYDKIVTRRRGGFCYELNGLFRWLLRALGYEVTLLSAEVAHADGGFSAPFDHLTLCVHGLDGADWLADVGFGDSFWQPLRLAHDVAQDGADGKHYRLRAADGAVSADGAAYWLLEQEADGLDGARWEPQYRFTLAPHVLGDYGERCHYQQTSPDSSFTKKRVCTLAVPDGRDTLSELTLIETRHGARNERVLPSEEAYRATLAERFGVVV